MSASEYRLRWQREGFRPRTKIYQDRKAAERYALILQGRMVEATGHDPDEQWCCSGQECGCRGATFADAWAERSAGVPPLLAGPTLEARAVGKWEDAV